VRTSDQVLTQGIIQSGVLRGLNKDTQMIPENNFDTCSTPIFTCKVKHKKCAPNFVCFLPMIPVGNQKKKERKKRVHFKEWNA